MLKYLLRRLVVPPEYQVPPLQNPWKGGDDLCRKKWKTEL